MIKRPYDLTKEQPKPGDVVSTYEGSFNTCVITRVGIDGIDLTRPYVLFNSENRPVIYCEPFTVDWSAVRAGRLQAFVTGPSGTVENRGPVDVGEYAVVGPARTVQEERREILDTTKPRQNRV
jgi:hypothetical protein